MRSAVIFGGSGFIGKHLVKILVSNGFSVTIMDIVEPNFSTQADFFFCDVRQKIEHKPKSEVDLVFNLSAVHRTPGHKPEEYYLTNCTGSVNILDWCQRIGVGKVIFTSSISVYGVTFNSVSEETIPLPNSDYGRSKLIAETIHRHWQKNNNDKSVAVVRPGAIFGEGEKGNFTRLAKALKMRYFFYPSDKNNIKACGYVKDLARALMFIANTVNEFEIYNFTFNQDYTLQNISERMAEVGGYSSPIDTELLRCVSNKIPDILPFRKLVQRMNKLDNQTIVSSKKLSESGFVWKYDLESALNDWHSDTEFDSNVRWKR